MVVWLDSGMHSHGWQHPRELVTTVTHEIITVGFVVGETETDMQLVESHWRVFGQSEGENSLGCIQAIAKMAIRSRKVLIPAKDYK